MKYYISKTLNNTSIEEAESNVIEKLKEKGFGIVTEMDIKATLKKKIDVDFKPYKILGACNPGYAHKALSTVDKVGVMLPCNVVIQQIGENDVEVFTVNPLQAIQSMNEPKLETFGKEVYDALNWVIDQL